MEQVQIDQYGRKDGSTTHVHIYYMTFVCVHEASHSHTCVHVHTYMVVHIMYFNIFNLIYVHTYMNV